MKTTAFQKRATGVLLMALGAVALSVPLATGRWSLSLLAIPLLALSVVQAYAALTSPQRGVASVILPSLLTMLAGILLFFSSVLVINGLLLLLMAILSMGGFSKILTAWRAERSARTAIAVNGLIDIFCAALLWYLSTLIRVEQAIGIAIGAYIAAAGWRMLAAPIEAAKPEAIAAAATSHPDPKLGLPPNETFAHLRAEAQSGSRTVLASDFMWMLTLTAVFFAIHLGRMPISDTVLGISSPFIATAGDVFMAAVLGMLLVLPANLLWKRLTRPVERLAWSLRLAPKSGAPAPNPAADWLIGRWLESRFNFDLRLGAARNSLRTALILILGLGLPITAFFVAFNPAWGFTWYFNTESWATGVYQKLTETRVDDWRVNMIDAVARTYGGDSDDLFGLHPSGVEGSGDFSFLVIGDPGEGDASQYSLIPRYLDLGRRDDVKFLVVSSDVIYPAGAIEDYERNFYLPFQGFAKPVYAIPGNHDWYDALEGFNANVLEPKAARAAIEARVEADYGLTSTNAHRMNRLVAEAARLRGLYGVDVAHQRAPFFELQTNDFALLAIDTGILHSVDGRQWAWLERALDRSRGKFTMAIVGHPRFAGGHDTPPLAEGGDVSDASVSFATLYRLLASRNVKIAMAGDTHDFEYYKEKIGGDGATRTMHHFVNGGGGAYLSIGTALDFPKQPDVGDWAFYPRTDHLRSKMETEMPVWKKPFWHWIKWFNAWPVSVEALSGVFDFNRAPFLQSFMEVRVERSKRRVDLSLNGVRGPLHWRDLQIGGDVLPPGATLDDPVEFLVPMDRD